MPSNSDKITSGAILLEILTEWGVDHQGVVTQPYSPGLAESTLKYSSGKFIFVIHGTTFRCRWIDKHTDPWSVPFQIDVFSVDLTDPESINSSKDTFLSSSYRISNG